MNQNEAADEPSPAVTLAVQNALRNVNRHTDSRPTSASVREVARLLGVHRATLYRALDGAAAES